MVVSIEESILTATLRSVKTVPVLERVPPLKVIVPVPPKLVVSDTDNVALFALPIVISANVFDPPKVTVPGPALYRTHWYAPGVVISASIVIGPLTFGSKINVCCSIAGSMVERLVNVSGAKEDVLIVVSAYKVRGPLYELLPLTLRMEGAFSR